MSQDVIEVVLEARTVTGKQVRQLRNQGIVPAVIHDHGKDSVLVQGELVALRKAVVKAGKHHPVKLKAAGKNYTAMITTIEFEPQKQRLTHVVFNAVSATEKVTAEIPVRPRYDEGNEASPAERNGLAVFANTDTVQVEAVSSKLPDVIEYDAEKLVEVGDNLTVADLTAPEGVTILTDPTQTVVAVSDPDAIAAANEAAAGDAVEADAAAVESDNGSAADDETDSQAAETQPGGKAQNQPKGE